jgi:hypothetical protein
MAIAYPIFPIQLPGQSFIQPAQPIRGGPSWNVKQTATFNNHKYMAVNGRSLVVKYWNNPLWKWEFIYEQLFNNPSNPNAYYPVPIPETDFEMLSGFYVGMQGQGNIFAYQPPDSARGGTFIVVSVVVNTPNVAILGISGGSPLTQLRLGDGLHCSTFSVATYLNGQNGTVIAFDVVNSFITLSIPTGGTHALVTDSGLAIGGQPLSAPDANNNIEVVHTIGGYPSTLSTSPINTLVTESVQVLELTSPPPVVYSNGSSVSYTILAPESTSPYQGYVFHFSSTPATPITAYFNYYYPCRFAEDTQEYENFMTMLWSCSAVKISQTRF